MAKIFSWRKMVRITDHHHPTKILYFLNKCLNSDIKFMESDTELKSAFINYTKFPKKLFPNH